MSLLVVASRIRRHVTALTLVTLLSCLSADGYAATAVGPTLLPSGSLAYFHVQVTELKQTPFSRFPTELFGRVRNELANLTVHNFGVDVTQLSEITIVVPPLEILQAHDSSAPPFVIAATFASKFNPNDVANNLPEGWERSNLGDATVFVRNDGNTLFAASPRTLVFGDQSVLGWWIEAQKQQQDSSLPEMLRESLGTGQIFFGANLSAIPQEALQQLPGELKNLLQAQLASATLNLSDNVTLSVELGYDSEKSAKQAKQELVSLQKQGRAILEFQEAEFQRQLTDANNDMDSSMQSIGALAAVRQVGAYLDNLKLTQQDAWVSTSLSVQADPSLFVVAAIAAAGSANEDAGNLFHGGSNQYDDDTTADTEEGEEVESNE